MKRNNKVAEFYNNTAELTWSLSNAKLYHVGLFTDQTDSLIVAQKKLVDSLICNLDLNEESILLDAGCGVGFPAIMISKHFKCKIEGVTISEVQCQKAQILIEQQNCNNLVKVHHMDMHSMSFGDNYFSVGIALESLLHTNRKTALLEIKRVLRPGAYFSLCDWYVSSPLTDAESLFAKEVISASYVSLSEYVSLLEACGFSDIQVFDWTDYVKPTYKIWNNVENIAANKVNQEFIKSFQHVSENLTNIALNKLGYVNIVAKVTKEHARP